MPKMLTVATHIPPAAFPFVSLDDVRRFSRVATIQDEAGFALVLSEFILEKARIGKPLPGTTTDLFAQLQHKAAALKADTQWKPSATDLQRGHAQMVKEFNQPQNLSVTRFATLANKSRQQVYKDIAARRLLAFCIGSRGQRIPEWQLDPVRLELTRQVLSRAADVDEWTLFHALSAPNESLYGKTPVEAVHKSSLNQVVSAVLDALGVHD